MLAINSVGAVGAGVAPGRVVFEHRGADRRSRRPRGGFRSGRLRQHCGPPQPRELRSLLALGTVGRELVGANGHHRLRSPHARPSQRVAPFAALRHSQPSVIRNSPSFLRRQESRRSEGFDRPTALDRPARAFDTSVKRRECRGVKGCWEVAWIPACAGMTEGGRPRSTTCSHARKSGPPPLPTACAGAGFGIPPPPAERGERGSSLFSVLPATRGSGRNRMVPGWTRRLNLRRGRWCS